MKARRSKAGCQGIRAGAAPATRPFTPTKIAIALCAAGFLSPPVIAGPTGGKVVAGTADIRTQGNRTDIVQSSDRAVIDWRSFSISPTEAVYFQQQSNRSVALNRVTGDQVSHIQGTLGAKGQVILLNPNGILFGAGAQVHASSFIASTSWLSSEDFMAGRLAFTAPARAADGTCPWSKCEGGSIVN
ncbi:MAG: filamentous hemagglutinin N-terminal domain-containing protein, partial [Burkholderiales bacterium]